VDAETSTVGFEVRHLKLAKVRGRFRRVEAAVSCDRDGIATIDAAITVASVDTGDERRDERLRAEDFFYVEHHPVATFSGSCATAERDETLVVRGTLTLRGVTRPLDLLAEPAREDDEERVRVRASAIISRREFGLEWDTAFAAGGLVIDDRVALRLDVVLVRGDTPA
jgi:polyisoprenoid-binding protein YceI